MANYHYQNDLESVMYFLEKAFNGSCDTVLNDWLIPIKTSISAEKTAASADVQEISDRGNELLMNGQFEEALNEFKRAQTIAPNSSLIAFNIGIYHLLNDDTLRAISYFERALRFDSTMSVVYRRLYNLYITQDKWDDAINMLEITKSKDNTWEYNFFLAYCYTKVENYQKAIACFNEAIALNSKNYIQYIFLGDAYVNLGNRVVAKDQYEHAIQIDPDRPEAYERLERLRQME